jgi:hypothetical protein
LELVEKIMTGIYRVQDIGNSFAYLENRRQTRRNFNSSVEELYNEMKNRLLRFQKKSFQRFEIGIWPNQL